MGIRAEVVSKDVILVTRSNIAKYSKETGEFIPGKESVNIEYFKECRLFKGTYSIKKEDWTYYCKSENFYSNNSYCLIINVNKKEEALKQFFKGINDLLERDMSNHLKSISLIKSRMIKIKELESKTIL